MTQTTGPADSSTTGKHIPALDGIRGLAVLMVLYFHFMWASPYSGHNPVIWIGAALKNVTWVGVDLFFVLSGFLITGILYDTRNAPRFFRNFYARRALRIFPLYYGVLIGAVLIGALLGGHVGWLGLLQTATYTRNLIFPNAMSKPAIWGDSVSAIQLNHFWSLAIEEQFYFVWPLVVYLLKTKRKIAGAALIGITASFFVRVGLLHYSQINYWVYLLSSWTPARLDGLFSGALLAMMVRSSWEKRLIQWSNVGMLVGLVWLGVLCWRYPYLELLQYHRCALWVYPALSLTFASMIASSLKPGTWGNRVFTMSGLRFFGRYSYGLYVYHYTIAVLGEKMRPMLTQATGSKILAVVLPAVVGFGLTVAISMASFRWYESRFLRFKRKFEDHTRAPKLEEYVAEGAQS